MKTVIVKGGIYKYPHSEDYAMYFNGALYFIEPVMPCLDMDVEHTSNLDEFELVDGYALGCVKLEENSYQWQIRNSGRKHSDDYIIAKGNASEHFMKQVNEYSKSF